MSEPGGIGKTFIQTFSEPAVFLDTPALYVTPWPPKYLFPGLINLTFFIYHVLSNKFINLNFQFLNCTYFLFFQNHISFLKLF